MKPGFVLNHEKLLDIEGQSSFRTTTLLIKVKIEHDWKSIVAFKFERPTTCRFHTGAAVKDGGKTCTNGHFKWFLYAYEGLGVKRRRLM